MRYILYSVILTSLTGCGLVGFENTNNVAVRKHNEPIELGKYSDVVSSDGKVIITRTVKYRAVLTADQKQAVTQTGIEASSTVDTKLAISNYLATILSSGSSELVGVVNALAEKPASTLTPEQALAIAITANKTNNNVEPSIPAIISALEKFISVTDNYIEKNRAQALISNIKK